MQILTFNFKHIIVQDNWALDHLLNYSKCFADNLFTRTDTERPAENKRMAKSTNQ